MRQTPWKLTLLLDSCWTAETFEVGMYALWRLASQAAGIVALEAGTGSDLVDSIWFKNLHPSHLIVGWINELLAVWFQSVDWLESPMCRKMIESVYLCSHQHRQHEPSVFGNGGCIGSKLGHRIGGSTFQTMFGRTSGTHMYSVP